MKTRAFALQSIQTPIYAVEFKKKLYCCKKEDKSIFIYGVGRKDISKKSKIIIDNLPVIWTAEDIQNATNKYGFNVVLSCLKYNNSNYSISDDGSYGLSYEKAELFNMSKYGKKYDELILFACRVNQEFISYLISGFGFSIKDGWLYSAKKVVHCVKNELFLYPSLYISHCLKGFQTEPSFDVFAFDKMLETLIEAIEYDAHYPIGDKRANIIERVVSVKDRIIFISNEEVEKKFEKMFEMIDKIKDNP